MSRAREWAEELSALTAQHHGVPVPDDSRGRVVLGAEERLRGERAMAHPRRSLGHDLTFQAKVAGWYTLGGQITGDWDLVDVWRLGRRPAKMVSSMFTSLERPVTIQMRHYLELEEGELLSVRCWLVDDDRRERVQPQRHSLTVTFVVPPVERK